MSYTSLSQQQINILRKALNILIAYSGEDAFPQCEMTDNEIGFIHDFVKGVQLNPINLPENLRVDELLSAPPGEWKRVEQPDLSIVPLPALLAEVKRRSNVNAFGLADEADRLAQNDLVSVGDLSEQSLTDLLIQMQEKGTFDPNEPLKIKLPEKEG